MKNIIIPTFALLILLSLAACNDKGKTDGTGNDTLTAQDTSNKTAGPANIVVYPLKGSPEYTGATLNLKSPEKGTDLSAGENTFQFEVKNFDLGVQTTDAAAKEIANSAQGQHIHFILNNGPYTAYYEPTAKAPLEDGHYVLLSFLSRSYHESLKNDKAYVIRQFVVGTPENYKEADLKAPHMFYSRPKGKYVGLNETRKVLLDFYLVNCKLEENGHKVRATINGVEFMLTEWQPYIIEGLPLGETTIKLELLDKDNALVPSPFNPVERTITLEQGNPS